MGRGDVMLGITLKAQHPIHRAEAMLLVASCYNCRVEILLSGPLEVPIRLPSLALARPSLRLDGFVLTVFEWPIKVLASVMNGQSNYFGFWLTRKFPKYIED